MNRDNLAAIDGALARNPRDIAALIAKADHLAQAGDVRRGARAGRRRRGGRAAWSV
ncbi:MAG TPA: hypothetical protein VLH12_11610 [Usitatibacter sp.]|nr:hypothetical protein [Usitatibacter sp.]